VLLDLAGLLLPLRQNTWAYDFTGLSGVAMSQSKQAVW